MKIILSKHRLILALKSSLCSQKSFMCEHLRVSCRNDRGTAVWGQVDQAIHRGREELSADQFFTNSCRRQDHIFGRVSVKLNVSCSSPGLSLVCPIVLLCWGTSQFVGAQKGFKLLRLTPLSHI